MRVKIENHSDRQNEVIVPLVEYAASFFPHRPGEVRVIVKNCRGDPATRQVLWRQALRDLGREGR